MDVEIPPGLQWVSYLAGGSWPQGSESGMGRRQEFLAAAAEQLDELIPELNQVRGETLSVLMGETAQAALAQFALLFDGDYAVDKLSDAIRALGESSGYTGSEIEYNKLSILVGLALAAAEISYALAMSAPTWGASTAAIPAIEWATITTFRQLVALLLRRLAAKVREMLARTTVKRLIHEGFQEAGQELAIAGTQETIVYKLQGDNYRVNGERLLLNGIASTVGGGAGGVTAVPTANFLGPAASRAGAATKGATTFFTAGVVGNLAGTASVGGEFDPFMIMVSSTTSSVGGLGGAGVAPGRAPSTSDGQQSGSQPPETGSPPEGDLPPPDDGDSAATDQDDDAAPVNSSNGNGQDPNSVNGVQVAEPTNGQSAPQAAADTDSVATQDDQTTAAATQTADDQSAGDSTTQAEPQSTHAGDTSDTPPQTQEGASLTGADTGGDHSSGGPSQGLPVADSAPDPSANGQPVAGTPADAAPSTVSDAGPDFRPESVVAAPISDPSGTTTPATADTGAPTDTPMVADPQSQPQATPPTPQSGVGPSAVPNAQAPTSSTTSTPTAPSTPTAQSTPTTATSTPATTSPKPTAQQDVPQAPKATASASDATTTPAARASDTTAKAAQQNTKDDSDQAGQRPEVVDDGEGRTERVDCLDKIAEALSVKLGRVIRLGDFPTARGRPATRIYQALRGGSEFVDKAKVQRVLGKMEDGSFAILTSAWAGGPNQGGHSWLAIKENGQIRFEDSFTGQSPQWGDDEVLRTAAGFFHADGTPRDPLRDVRQLIPAAAIGYVAGPPLDGNGSLDGDRDAGERWRDVVPQNMVADSALARRVPPVETADQLRNPLGLMEAASARARDNANWWADLTGAEQRALIDTYPHHIGNAEGIPAAARHEANSRSLDQDRRELQARRERGETLTRDQRKQLDRLNRIHEQLAEARDLAQQAEVGGPLLLAFDPLSFGGDGRAVVSFGADPYSAESVSWHVPGLKMNIDQLGPCMGDAFKHLQSTLQENPTLRATSIAWIGYDTPSGVLGAARHDAAREGAAILYSDIRAFNAARDTWAGDGSHFSGNHVFAHSYGSTTASYAGRDGRLANDVRTVTLIGSPGAGPVQRATEFGDTVDVYVASSSRDPVAGLGARVFDAAGRIFGVNLGIDPAMDSFGAQRITAEFSAGMDRRRNWGTHLAYYKFVDRAANPPVRTESLANFGRIAAGHPDRLDLESHRTIEDRNLRRPHVRTVEPAAGRPLRLDGDTEQSGDRQTRRLWNPRWRTQPTDVDPSHVDDDSPTPDESPAVLTDEVAAPTQLDPEVAKQIADVLLEERGIAADDLMSPADHRVAVQDAVARARENGLWWKGLSETQQLAMIQAYPHQVGNSEGIPPMARHAANSLMLQSYLAERDVLVSQRENGVGLNADQVRFIDLMNDVESALRSAERNTHRANVGGPYLLALDPDAFDGHGRAIVSFGENPYTAKSVSWYVPGMTTTIEKLRPMMLRAFNQLQSTLRESPGLSAASITYIGYKAPGSWDPKVISQQMARQGGEIFCSDMLSFNAGRDVFHGDGSHFSGNHVFAHSYGSSTVSHAGYGRRLGGEVQTITLIGSPGAGPLRHARDFGIGDNVFVAASSRDQTTGLGGERPGEKGRRVRNLGQGMDPAMDSFGAQRITAEFPAALDHLGRGSRMTHSLYWAYMDPGVNPQVRSESLVNFGRIAAGHSDRVDLEGHRTLGERARFLRSPGIGTVEPAIGRPLRLVDDPTAQHPVNRRRPWNPRFRNLPAESIETPPVDVDDGPLELDEDIPTPAELQGADVEQMPAPAKVVADVELAARGIKADDMMSPADHKVPVAEAVARAKANAQWWRGLTQNQQQALIHAYPHQVGNAEGIPPMARHQANSLMLQRYLRHRDILMSRRDNGVALNRRQEQYLDLMNTIEDGMRVTQGKTDRAGVGGPYLLALDPRAFNGVGRAIISFGADPYTADSVSWYVPGMSTTIEKVGTMMRRGLNILQSTLQENPKLNAASITYLGYKPPSSWDIRVLSQRMARNGGQIFCSDVLSFNAGRDIFAGDGSHFSGHHIFAHSYGSSTVSHAGGGRRLAGQVQTITLIGSPGAGPLRHASDFGIGADNVFVAASSRDKTTGLGGERAGEKGRIIRFLGQGMDPAMDSFGAQRITAEFPAALDRTESGSRMTHSLYWAYMDPGVNPHVRSESLANFGRIAAGHTDRVDLEGHRTLGERPRLLRRPAEDTIEPAIGRPLRLGDDPVTHFPVNRRNYWNPNFLRDANCAFLVAQELSSMYGRDFTLAVDPSPRGVPAFRLFEAVGSSARFATYADVEARLRQLGPGSSAVLASRWRGRGQSGHAFLAVNDGGDIYLVDPHSGERSGWPPPWSEDAVRRTAVGYLDADGVPVNRYDGTARQLAAAGFIGRVQGLPGTSAAADAALAQRVPQVQAEELVNPVGSADLAVERARANAEWWAGLSDTQRQELIDNYPLRIGNAEGIPAVDRDIANRRVLQHYRERADVVRTKIDEFVLPSREDRAFLQRVNRIDAALNKADADAQRAGLEAPLLLAFDPAAFDGNGRAVISFGGDPYTAETVSWHTGSAPLDKLGTVVRPALDDLQAMQQESPSAAVIAWVGDHNGTSALHSDLAAFHAAREAFGTTPVPFTGNHVHTMRSPSTSLWVPRDAGSQVLAHRGASHEFPEQTLAAYREALRQGARGLECDVRLTKDGHLVCIHDKRVDRTSNGSGNVGDMTLAELQELDFGGWHPSRELGDTRSETGILTLEQLLQLVAAHDQPVTLFIETKHPDHGGWKLEREVVALLERYGMDNPESPEQARAAVISFYPDALWRVRRAAPNLPTVLLGPAADYLAGAVGATGIGPSIKALRANPGLVDAAAARGMTTYCWTVNDQNDVQYARDLGVGWIATDHPGQTGTLLQSEPTAPVAQDPPTPTTETPVSSEPDVTAAVAEAALAQRVPPVRPDELRNPFGVTEEAVARAQNNASWWEGLAPEQRQALIETHPQHIGNAEGILAADRDAANRIVLQQLRDQADTVQSKIDDGKRTRAEERKFLQRVNRLEDALRKAAADAEKAGESGPLLLAFDPAEFGGDGRAVLSFGDDPLQADSVSWHAPGVGTTVHSLFGFSARNALNHLQSTRVENPSQRAASIAWIGYDAPSGSGLGRMTRQTAAGAGGDILYSDIRAFNAGRDVWAGDGSRFTGNHVFGYSYGSTTTAYAGRDGRLATHVSTVSLVGSPGAGPMRSASEFGPGVDVYVASSSRDLVTSLGGRTPGSFARFLGPVGRFFGVGLGVDPAMDSFGAVRVTAEFPGAMNLPYTGGTHHAYFQHTDSTSDPSTRTESLANLGRISAGQIERLELEQHRTADGRRTIEPAAERAGPRRFWNPSWARVPNCAQLVAIELSSIYGRDIRLAVSPSRRGVPARALFEAIGANADFTTYDDVANTLQHMPEGSTAVLVSRWSGGRQGGHAYLARNIDDNIQLIDPHTGERSGWPPHWGQDAVARTAVGYLDANGRPVDRISVDIPLRLDAADAVGRVKGVPAEHDFTRRQAEYRAQDPATRRVDTRYAEPLGDVVDNVDAQQVRQLAADLSGMYGPYRVQLRADVRGIEVTGEVILGGEILSGDQRIGHVRRTFIRDFNGDLVARHDVLEIEDGDSKFKGFSTAFNAELERFYVHAGVTRIELTTDEDGGVVWALRGFTWNPDSSKLQKSFDQIKESARLLRAGVSVEAQRLLDQYMQQLDPTNARLPEPIELATLATSAEPNLGRDLLTGTKWHAVRHLPTVEATTQSRSGFGAWLKRTLGWGVDRDANCARVVADELSALYGREFRVVSPHAPTGVPAWALFEAVGSGAEFATYDEIAATLRRLGDGSSAVLASRWSTGRQGGHAYLAINEGGQVRLYDPHTGERSGWPPHWGEDAVSRTAVGYLDTEGNPVQPLHDVPLQLAAADSIGDVKGPVDDSSFSRRKADYRRQDPATRQAQARYAEPVGEVLAGVGLNPDGPDQLAADLCGVYGPCRIEMTQEHFDEGDPEAQMWAISEGVPLFGPSIYGDVWHEDQKVGTIHWWIRPDKTGVLTVQHSLFVDRDFPIREFTDAVAAEMEPYLLRSGVVQIDTRVLGKTAYAAGARGEAWNPDPELLAQSLDEVKRSADELWALASDETRRVLDKVVARLDPEGTDIPPPIELAALSTPDDAHLGRELLEGTGIYNPYLDETRPETQLHTVIDLRGDRADWLPADEPVGGRPEPVVARFDPAPADAGVPVVGHVRFGPDFASRQENYRADDSTTRRVEPSYADPLDVVVNGSSSVAAAQLAADLSGVYGDYRVEFVVSPMQDSDRISLSLTGDILRGDDVVGGIGRTFYRDAQDRLIVENDALAIYSDEDAFDDVAREIDSALEPYYWRHGVHHVTEEVVDGTGGAAVARGFTWDPDLTKLGESLANMTESARELGREVDDEARAVLRSLVKTLNPTHPDLPTPAYLNSLDVGERLLAGANWWGAKYRPPTDATGASESTSDADLEFLSQQAEYRMTLPNTRQVDARYAQPLDAVVDNASPAAAAQLGEDLTGLYGTYGFEFEGYVNSSGHVVLEGDIFSDRDEIGAVAFTFESDDAGNLTVLHELHITGELADGAAASQRLIAELMPSFIASGIDQIVSTTHGETTLAAIDLSETWDTDPRRLQDTIANLTRSANRLLPMVADDARIVLEEVQRQLAAGGDQLPSPARLASLETEGEPDLGRRLLDGTALDHDGTGVSTVKTLWNVDTLAAGHNCGPWALAQLSARFGVSYPLNVTPSERGVPARALFEAIGSRADFMTYTEVERLLSQLKPTRPGERGPAALLVSSWVAGAGQGGHAYLAVFENGRVQLRDAFTGAPSRWPPYWGEGAVSRTAVGILNSDGSAVMGLDAGPDPYAAADEIGFVQGSPDPLGLPRYSPGTLSDAEARAAYIDGERRMHELNERLTRESVGIEERARLLSALRDSLRAWTRDLMSNRGVADFLATYEGNPTFDELVARNEARGLVGDAVYEAIIATATHGHHPPGTLSDIETTALYTEFEVRMRDYNEQLTGDGVSAEQRARILSELRNSLRAWTRELMSNRVVAEFLTAYEGNPTFAELVARNESKGLAGDAVYEAIIYSASHSHYAAGTLSDDETRTVYTTFELRMGEVHAQLVRDSAGAEERARTMYGMRAALRSWTRALMENRELAEYLNANEPNPTFEALVERQRTKKGLTGDAIFEAIVASSMRSRSSVNEALGIDPENPPPLPPMRGAHDPPERRSTDE